MAAVVNKIDAPQGVKKNSKLSVNMKVFENAWWSANAEVRDGKPYLSRSGLVEKLQADGVSETLISRKLRPGSSDQLIGSLRMGEIIVDHDNGWLVNDLVWSNILMLNKNSR